MPEKKTGRLQGWLGYTWSRSFRQFEAINRGERFPFIYDRPHDLELTFNYIFNEKWRLSANFVYQTGRPVSLPETVFRSLLGRMEIMYLSRNNARLPDYHRLDIQLSRSFTTRKKGREASLNFGVYNIYGRPNTLYLDVGGEFLSVFSQFDRIRYNVLNVSFFRFIPSLNYTVKW